MLEFPRQTNMRIQEMKFGLEELINKAAEQAERQQTEGRRGPGGVDRSLDRPAENELDQHVWAVVSFDKVMARGVSYNHAAELLNRLASNGIPGLCIITADAAARVG